MYPNLTRCDDNKTTMKMMGTMMTRTTRTVSTILMMRMTMTMMTRTIYQMAITFFGSNGMFRSDPSVVLPLLLFMNLVLLSLLLLFA